MAKYYLYTDGGSRGNPGPSAIGGVCQTYGAHREMLDVFTFSECIGETTNNVAEYKALLKGLQMICEMDRADLTEVSIFMDSELIIRQMLGRYRVKAGELLPLHEKVKGIVMILSGLGIALEWNHVPRHMNQHADRLVNKALDMRGDRG